MLVKELIARLEKADPDGEVCVKAACCNHAHDIEEVRDGDPDNAWDHGAAVVVRVG